MAETNSTECIFAEALMRSSAERRRYLDEVCAGDVERRQDVESLLEAHEKAGGFLDDIPMESSTRASTLRVSVPLPREDIEAIAPPKIAGFRLERTIGRGGLGV